MANDQPIRIESPHGEQLDLNSAHQDTARMESALSLVVSCRSSPERVLQLTSTLVEVVDG